MRMHEEEGHVGGGKDTDKIERAELQSVVPEELVREPAQVASKYCHGHGDRHEQAVVVIVSQPVKYSVASGRHQLGD
eukprot:CAMPEP_0181222214 /NCGR_PEP_ID=MMETSP1096-20121128/29839_1 /TAXON_ID=156174 ORGANISM="Chrysochromulina ericina, Strain CCMP281" /NCGR_SAMPLE_ID=MMETSP1096 /ASSEMBLY_ACC=CAM_ASM_000453 /LENGTH=76 /DNA_ID=CAMNT_0023314945 /DNA_START=739 /DNA_END=966 /DNA_ORIENTATION=+